MPITPTGSLVDAQRQSLSAAFRRAAEVQQHLGLEHRDSEIAADAVLNGTKFLVQGYRATTARALRHTASSAAWHAGFTVLHVHGSTVQEFFAVRAVVRARILGTPLALSTLTKVFPVGGWYSQLAMEVLANAR